MYKEDVDRALFQLLQNKNDGEIERLQFYHTHPRSPAALNLSSLDVTEAIRVQKVMNDAEIKAPFDMHAMPYDIAFLGEYEKHQKPTCLLPLHCLG